MANSKRKCKQCKEYFPVEAGVKFPAGWFCSHDHAIEFARSKAKRDTERKQRAEHKEAKEKLKTLSDYLREAQIAFNAYIRERDKDYPCISCLRKTGSKMNAGHYRSVGSSPNLRFEEKNCNIQCEHCNSWKSGNAIDYRINLIKKIGIESVEALESDHEPRRYRIEDAKRIKEEYKQKLKELKNG